MTSSVFQNLQELVGLPINRLEYNKDIAKAFLLRRAREKGLRLPSNPTIEEYKYHGAHVETPQAGISEKVVYVDASSMYPSLLFAINGSPETLIGTAEDLADSEYTEDDCVWGYIDTRNVRHHKGSGWQAFADPTEYKMVYDPSQGTMRWRADPEYTKCYFLAPEIERGFLPGAVDDAIALKNQYRGQPLYASTKRITNSIGYGVTGFAGEDGEAVEQARSSSRGPLTEELYGFDLYDWRIAESICLCGRKMIQWTRDRVLDAVRQEYPDTHVKMGDSVPADEPVVIRNENKNVNVVSISQLEGRSGDIEVWSDDGFVEVQDVIRKPNRKTMHCVRTLDGAVNVTEDHSLVRSNGTEVSPQSVNNGESLLHYDTGQSLPESETRQYKPGIPWVLGLFVAEGTCNEYERKNGSLRYPWAIVNQDKELLSHAAQVLEEQWSISTKITDARKSSGCWKLQLKNNSRGDRKWIAMDFRGMCYNNGGKCVPKSILNGTEEERREFLYGFHSGDGHVQDIEGRERDFDEFTTKSKQLATGISMLLKSFGWGVTVDTRENHDSYYYRIRAVESDFLSHDRTEVRNNTVVEYDGDYVYDLQTKNGHFHAGVGDIIVHNTDGVGIAVAGAPTRHEALSTVQAAVTELESGGYDQFFTDQFNVDPENHRAGVDVESFAPRVFVPAEDGTADCDTGVQKRYAQWVTIEDGEEVDEISITGLEHERSDVAPITKSVQAEFFDAVLRMGPIQARETVAPMLREAYDGFALCESRSDTMTSSHGELDRFTESDGHSLDTVCKRSGIGQPLTEYGSATRSPQKIVKGAKYADRELSGVDVSAGDTVRMVYVSTLPSDLPATYTAQTGEGGDPVEVISVPAIEQLPEGVSVDWKRHRQKTLVEPMDDLLGTLGWSWDGILHDHERSTLTEYT